MISRIKKWKKTNIVFAFFIAISFGLPIIFSAKLRSDAAIYIGLISLLIFYALVIYMNEKNIHGGTQFVRRVDTPTPMETLESVDDEPLIKKPTKINPIKPWWWHESEWQQYCLIPMKFNRLISYRSNLCHAPYTNGRFYHKNPRKIISGVF